MSTFCLPDLGEGLAEAVIVRWHVAEGDRVESEQLLVSVETAKAIVDVPSPQRGRILHLLAAEGETVLVHAALVEFAEDESRKSISPPPEKTADAGSVVGNLAAATSRVSSGGFLIGRHRHTEARLQKTLLRRPAADMPVAGTPLFSGGEPLEPLRRAMADNLARAHRDVVLVTLTDEAVIHFEDRRELTARLVQALVAAAQAEPALNAWYDGTQQRRLLHEAVHVGIAVDTPQGLLVPVLKHAGQLALMALNRRVAQLKKAAHAQTLSPDMIGGATITLSNFGSLAGRHATPLVTPPQVAILGVGHAYEGVRAEQQTFRAVRLLPLSLSFDHRAVTGGEAARFLAALTAALEEQ